MIWLTWERVYFRLKILLFRKSILWNVIKKGESVLTEQTIETKKNLPHKRKKILVKACATIYQHSTAQQKWEMKCLFMGLMVEKKNENTVKFVSKIKLREKMFSLNGYQWNRITYDIDPCLPWLVVGVSIMRKRMNSTGVRTGEIGSSSSTIIQKGEWSLTSW